MNIFSLTLYFVLTCSFSVATSCVASDHKIIQVINGRVLRTHKLRCEDLWISKGKIIEPQQTADEIIDAAGLIVAPGYIDLQINGGFGYDFSCNPERVHFVAKKLPRYGVTSFLPTVVSSEKAQYAHIIPFLRNCPGSAVDGSSILGSHLEGPFFSSKQPGAHELSLLYSIEIPPLDDFYSDLTDVKIITLAPELAGSAKAITFLKNGSIVAAAGHTHATYDEMHTAVEAGIRLTTHLFNAMAPLHHREPGVVGCVLADKATYYSIIADTVHLHPATVKLAWSAHPEGLVLVTDAMQALGLADGRYQLGGLDVDVDNKKACIADTKTIAGSIVGMDEAVRNFKAATGCTTTKALEAASLKPAEVLKITDQKGSLLIGRDADFILLNDALDVVATYIAGQQAWPITEYSEE